MVESGVTGLEWPANQSPSTRHDYRDRCLAPWMGSSVGGHQHGRALVRGREIPPHQPPGVDGGRLRNEGVCTRSARHPHSPAHGQHHSNCVRQPHGGNEIPNPVTGSLQTVAMVPQQRDYVVGRAPPRSGQHDCGPGVADPTHIHGVDVGQNSVSGSDGKAGALHNRSVRITTQQPAPMVCMLAARPLCHSDRCSPDAMAGRVRLCLPSVCASGQVPPEGQERQLLSGSDHTSVEHAALVPGVADGLPSPVTTGANAIEGSVQQSPPNAPATAATVSRLESLWANHSAEGISGRASTLILSGWSKGTNTTYESGWNKWRRWCLERGTNPFSCDIGLFLAELFEQGLQHRSINTIRSAVSMTHSQVEGAPLGQHPLVSRLLKGIHNKRPPMPRYSVTWDVDVVTRYLESLGENGKLSLKQLSQKLVLLMALVEASRTSELQALDLRFKVQKPEGVTFRLASLTKKRTPGLPPKELFFGAFPENKFLCVVKCLAKYEVVTAGFHGKGDASFCPTQDLTSR